MDDDALAAHLRRLDERLARLEAVASPNSITTAEVLADPAAGAVSYAGSILRGDDTLLWRAEHEWREVVSAATDAARVLAALGSPVRLRIVAVLLERDATTGELADRLDDPSTGQLFHHLKELLAAGVVHQPVRGTYAVLRQNVIPLLAVLAAGGDVATSGEVEPS